MPLGLPLGVCSPGFSPDGVGAVGIPETAPPGSAMLLPGACVSTGPSVREYRALDNELFFRNKMLAGALYRAELADRLRGLGTRSR